MSCIFLYKFFCKIYGNRIIINFLFFSLVFNGCTKQPYKPPAYSAKAIVIGEEKCSVDSNYNYWLLDLSLENNSPEHGDTILYNGIVYNHAFKTGTLDTALRHSGKKASFDFNFASNNHIKIKSSNCDAPGAETFLLTDILLFHQSQLQ